MRRRWYEGSCKGREEEKDLLRARTKRVALLIQMIVSPFKRLPWLYRTLNGLLWPLKSTLFAEATTRKQPGRSDAALSSAACKCLNPLAERWGEGKDRGEEEVMPTRDMTCDYRQVLGSVGLLIVYCIVSLFYWMEVFSGDWNLLPIRTLKTIDSKGIGNKKLEQGKG